MSLVFREIDPTDYAEVYAFNMIQEYTVRDSSDIYVADSDEDRAMKTKRIIEQLMKGDQKYYCLAVFAGGEMIGGIFQDRYKIDKQPACHIHGLWVHPQYRKQGLGRELKEKGELWAKSMGCTLMDTNVRVGNRSMISLNEHLGYEVARLNFRKRL